MTPEEVTAHLIARARWHHSRASGPGGQHRDHTETRAELVIGPAALDGLPEYIATAIASAFGLNTRPARLSSQRDRSLERNRQTIEARLLDRVTTALTPKAPRRPTRTPRGVIERRLRDKAATAARKATRRRPDSSE